MAHLRFLSFLLLAVLLGSCAAAGQQTSELLFHQIQKAYAEGELREAQSLVDHLLKQDPDNFNGLYMRALIHEKGDDLEAAIEDLNRAIELRPDRSQVYHRRGETQFKLGNFEAALKDFDYAIYLEPEMEPYSWQKGIALWFAGKYPEAAKQFELHKTVNPNDVENATWHFISVAKVDGVAEASARLLPVGPDERVPMTKIYELYSGAAEIADILLAINSGSPDEEELASRAFHADLYIGLFYFAHGDLASARHYTLKAEAAAVDHHYMWHVARLFNEQTAE